MGGIWVGWQETHKQSTTSQSPPNLWGPNLCYAHLSHPTAAESCALTPGGPSHTSAPCAGLDRGHRIPLHTLPCVRPDLHQGGEHHGKCGHGEAQHIEKGDGSEGLLCIQDVVLIHKHVDSKARQGDLG